MGLVMRLGTLLVAALSILASAHEARAGAARFVIEPPDCVPSWFDGRALEAMLRADTSSTTRAFIAVTVPDCAHNDLVEFTVIRSGRAPSAGRLDLTDVPESARLRSVAIVVTEHLDSPTLPRPSRPVRPAAKKPLPPTKPRWRWGIVGQPVLHVGLRRGEALFGAAVAVEAKKSNWGLQLEIEAATGTRNRGLGQARAWLAGGQLWPRLDSVFGPLEWSIGPSVGLGVAALSSTANTTDASVLAQRLVLWLGGRARVAWPVSRTIRIHLGLDGRGFLRGLAGTQNGVPIMGLSGPYARIGLGISWRSL